MKICVLMTGTNNVPVMVDPLEGLGHELTRIVYDELTYEEHERLPGLVAEAAPDWVLYVGALRGHHGKPVPSTEVLARVGARWPLVHLCCDGAEPVWWPQLEDYYDNGRFALQVNVDGTRTGPIGERGLTTVLPVDLSQYENKPWAERAIWCGFAGSLHGERKRLIEELQKREVVTFRPRNAGDADGGDYRRFLGVCRTGVNFSITGGQVGGAHLKYRCLELAAAGCLVIESAGSPLRNWGFEPGRDYVEHASPEDVQRHVTWARADPEAVQALVASFRAKLAERHSPAVFWSQVLERLGHGRAERPVSDLVLCANWKDQPRKLDELAAVPPSADLPRLVASTEGCNLVAYDRRVWVVPQRLGSLDLANEHHRFRWQAQLRAFDTVEQARLAARAEDARAA